MADERGTFGIVGKAFETTKIYGGSNIVKHFDGIVEGDTLKTLADYAVEHGIETSGIDPITKLDPRLEKYNMVKLTPTRNLDEVDSPLQMYLITDEKGHDIGTYEITEHGPVFKLSPKIKEQNDKIIEKFQGEGREILEGQYNIDNLEELAEKLSKGEDIALASEEQARDDISEEYEKRGISTGEEQQDPDEKEALDKIPQDMRGEAVEFARQNGIQVKEILIVDNPETLARSIDNRDNQISENGGPVILIKAKSGKALDLDDDIYAFQDGQAIQNEANDKALGAYMKDHEDEGHVTGLEPIDNSELYREAKRIYEEAQAKIEAEEEEIAQIQYNMENIEVEEGQDEEMIMEQMQSEIASHQENIAQIVKDRDVDLKELLSRNSREKVMDEPENQIDTSSASLEDENDEAVMSLWDKADPNKPKR